MFFKDFMDGLSKQHGLHKDVDGSVTSMKVTLPRGVNVHILYDALDQNKRSYVRMGTFVPPITKDGRQRFMNFVLDFNRFSRDYMDVGLMPHPQNDAFFALTWYVGKQGMSQHEWEARLGVYENLALTASEKLQNIMTEWTHSIH